MGFWLEVIKGVLTSFLLAAMFIGAGLLVVALFLWAGVL